MDIKQNIIFLHIPKTGGKTLNSIFSRYYAENEMFELKFEEYNDYMSLVQLPDSRKEQIRYLSGHMQYGIHKYFKKDFTYITILRDPIDRLLSHYYFIKRTPTNALYKTVVNNHWTFDDFIEHSEALGLYNVQIRLLSGIEGSNALLLEKALDNIDNYFSFVGLQEYYNESLIILKQRFNLNVPYYKTVNLTKERPSIQTISPKTKAFIADLNKEDFILYNTCKLQFQNQLKLISFLHLELKLLKLYNTFYSSTKLKKLVLNFNSHKK